MKFRVLAIGAVAAVLGIAAAGCGGSDSAEPAPAPSEPAPAEPAPAEPAPAEPAPAEPAPAEPAPAEPAPAEPAPAEPAPAEPAPPAGDLQTELVVMAPDVAPAIDPDGSTASVPEVQELHLNLMEPLLDYPLVDNGQGVLEPQYQVGADGFAPRLAESWSSQANEDGTVTWTFKLKQGVQSCAGNELKADDVLYTWARGKSVSGGSPVVWFLGNVSKIFDLSPLAPTGEGDEVTDEDKALKDTEVKKVDDYTVQFTQSVANELFPRVLAITFMDVFDSTVMQANATEDDPWSHQYTETKDSPGYGAYCMKEYTKGNQVILEANPNYYRGAPQFTKVTYRKVPQSANRVGAIQNGDADVITSLTPQEIKDLRTQDNVSVLGWQNNKGLSLGLSFNFEPWNLPENAKLRQAIAYALPYDEILTQDFGGDAVKWNGACASRYYGYVDQPIYNTDPEKAKQLLAEAGFPEGKGLEQYADGLKLFYVAERANVLEPIANRIRTSLAAIGINISLNPISNAEYGDRSLTKYDLPMFIQDVDRPLAPDVGYCAQLFFVSKANGGLNTPSAYDNAEFDELYAQSATTTGEERLGVLKTMQEKLMVDLPQVPIAEPASFIATKKGVVNCWAGQPYDLLSFWHFRSGDCSAVTDAAPGGQEATDTAATDTAAATETTG
ncbi:MAG: ABC transporter substrate-binding protein [Thermoleophilia bacterium]